MTDIDPLLDVILGPAIKLYWKGYFGKLGDYWYPDSLKDEALLLQFIKEAGVKESGKRLSKENYDAVLAAAGKNGYGINALIR